MKEKITMEFSEIEKELLLENKYVLSDETIGKLTRAKNKKGFFRITLRHAELDDIVGHICFLANHEEDPDTCEELNDLADHLEAHL